MSMQEPWFTYQTSNRIFFRRKDIALYAVDGHWVMNQPYTTQGLDKASTLHTTFYKPHKSTEDK